MSRSLVLDADPIAGAQVAGPDLVAECAKLLDGVRVRPTNLHDVASKLGVKKIIEDDELPYSGLLRARSDGAMEIVYAPAHKPAFTIAHELGHALVRHHAWVIADEEKFCDQFAAELLMPDKEIANALQQPLSVKRLFDLADNYRVSLRALAIKLEGHHQMFGAVVADVRGCLWRAGFVREYGGILQEAVADVLRTGEPLREPVTRTTRNERESWILEARQLSYRTTDVMVLLIPDRSLAAHVTD